MNFGDKLNTRELDVLLNSWPEGTMGNTKECCEIAALDVIGAKLGYGHLAQLAQWLYEVQCHGNLENAARLKRERFAAMGWPLPAGFESVAGR